MGYKNRKAGIVKPRLIIIIQDNLLTMKLYAKIIDKGIVKGYGGNELMIEVVNEKKEVIARIQVSQPPYIDYEINVFPVALPNSLMLDVKGHGYRLTRKLSEQEKGK